MNDKKFVCGTKFSDMSKVPNVSISKMNNLPKKFDLRDNLYPVIDQGNKGICASVAVTDSLLYLYKCRKNKLSISRSYFYDNRQDKSIDGMSISEAMAIAKRNNLIKTYGKANILEEVKTLLVTQGPVVIALPVYSYEENFWRKTGKLIGGHAVVIAGYDEDGFVVKNSWGRSFANNGYVNLPYSDFKYVKEIWVICN